MILCQQISLFCILLICNATVADETFCPPQELILPCRCSQKGTDIQVWCSHSDLPRILHGIKSVAKTIIQPIDELILENNQLPSLPGKFFSPQRVIRLMLRHNSVERLANGWLNDLENSLVEIYIVEQNLRNIPLDSLLGMKKLEAVTIQSESIKRIPLFSGLPRLRYIRVESSSLVDITQDAFRDVRELETIQITGNSRLGRLEAGLFYDLPKLRALNVANNGISWIHLRALSRLPNLESIDLSGNKISDAGMIGRALKDLKRLEILKLDKNHITMLTEGSFVDLPGLKELLLNDNAISEIQHGAFHRTPNLKLVRLENNFLSRVHPESFLQSSGSGVEYLHLQQNEIARTEELRSLLSALPMLKFLDLSNNRLQDIPFGALRGHGALEQLYLDNNLIRRIERDAFLAMPALRELRLKNNSLHDLLPLPFWNLPGLKGLDLSSNQFKRIDPPLLMGLPSLRRLDIGDNLISVIDPGSFIDTPYLETINISRNELSMIHPATFRDLDKLFEIDASYNSLQEIIPGLPRSVERVSLKRNKILTLPQPPNKALDLPNLRMLDMGGNTIQRIPRSSFKSLSQLRFLSLAKNRLQTIDQASLLGLDRLEMLNLQNNRIMAVHERSMENLSDLRNLNMQGNRIELFVDNILMNQVRLERIDLSRNNLIEIAPNSFRNSRSLISLDVSNNNLKELPESVSSLTELVELDVSFNRLTNLKPEMLSSLRNLEELRASNNRVPSVSEETFRDLAMLQYLDLSSNELVTMEVGSVKNLPQLQELVLADNRLEELGDRVFEDLPNLQAVHLQQNNLRYISPRSFFRTPSVVYLNISSNKFENLEHIGLRSVRNLEVLDLSNNGIRRITTNPLRGLDWLVELKLDDNRICKVQGEPFSSMPRLRVLTMRNNRLTTITEPTFRSLRGNLAFLDLDGNTFDCSCEMLWLNAWYQETESFTHYPGPRCRDGTMLRELRMTRSDCQTDGRSNQLPLTNDHGDTFVRQLDYSECDDEIVEEYTTNSNRPSAGESEYFYDQYIDYPINETHLVISNNSSPVKTNAIIEGRPSGVNISNTVLNFNKNRPVQPQQKPSQFTFFGVPLPSLNLWGNNGRSTNTRAGTGTHGKARVQVYRPEDMEIFKFLNRNDHQEPASHRSSSNLQAASNYATEPNQNISFYRPYFKTPFQEPQEVHTGGFTPMFPGSGGFHPILNPHQNISDDRQSFSYEEEGVTENSDHDVRSAPEIHQDVIPLPQNVPIDVSDQDEPDNVDHRDNKAEETNIQSDQDQDHDHGYVDSDTPETTTLSALQNYLADMNSSSKAIAATESIMQSEEKKSIDRSSIESSSSENYIITTPRSSTKPNDPWHNLSNSPSSLSDLVAPGAQIGIYRTGGPPGRSTITKIFSTPTPKAEEFHRTTSINKNQNTNGGTELDSRFQTDSKNSFGTTTTYSPINSREFPRKKNMDWYYNNYNKTVPGAGDKNRNTFDPSLNSLRSSANFAIFSNFAIFIVSLGHFILNLRFC